MSPARDRFSLVGRVAVVTGGSRGIGHAIGTAFLEAGASVVFASRNIDETALPDANSHASLRSRAAVFRAHVGKRADGEALIAFAEERFGTVDVLVNNAATNPHFGPLLTIEDAALRKTFEVNIEGYLHATRAVVARLQACNKPGSIVNIASVAGLMAAPMQGAYGMSKAAIVSMTKTLAVELAGTHIRVNAIAPGFVDTKLAAAVVKNDLLLEKLLERTPQRRYAQPDEIVGAALFLATDASSYTTGHTMVVDGGLTLG